MINLSNFLSILRLPLAFLFLQQGVALRLFAIIAAMITDSVDGYFARKSNSTSRFGAILDPTMDKFFVYFALFVLFFEGKIVSWEIGAMLSRDVFLCVYGAFMLVTKRWGTLVFRAIRWGKVTTALQFIVLLGLVSGFSFSWILFASFVIMGWLAFLELLQLSEKISTT